jgi:hypothetical protein
MLLVSKLILVQMVITLNENDSVLSLIAVVIICITEIIIKMLELKSV